MEEKRNKEDIRTFFSPQKQNEMKEEKEQEQPKESKPLNIKNRGHFFRFRKGFTQNVVTCDPSVTILEALHSNSAFKSLQSKNPQREPVIQRENTPRAAINTDFPCCLIDQNELLNISFIKSNKRSSPDKRPDTHRSLMRSPENFCTFNIKTTGGKNIHWVMKNSNLKQKVDYVCIYALRGEKLKTALMRDGRFNPVIFRKHCALSELGSKNRTNMSNTVDHLHKKEYEVIIIDSQPASQDFSQELFSQESVKNEESDNASASSPRPESANNKGTKEPEDDQQPKPQPTVNEKKSRPRPQNIPDSGEILKLLRDQFGGLLEQLKVREQLKKPTEVQKYFREEYDKSVHSFSEVKRVKRLMALSNSVCQIRVESFALGTGFLLFDRFILTNAHVVKKHYDQFANRLLHPITAVFDFEDLEMVNKIAVKENPVSFFHGKQEIGQHLDFALLELEIHAEHLNCLALLSRYSPPPTGGGICIIGHPEGGVMRLDPCYIIEKDRVQQTANKHLQENQEYFHVITQQCLAENWEPHPTQISYNSCFFYGSSGSPVFDDYCNLIGVHTGGYCYTQGKKTRSVMEYALPMLPILVCIVKQSRQTGRTEVVEYFEAQNNMSYVLQLANKEDLADGHDH